MPNVFYLNGIAFALFTKGRTFLPFEQEDLKIKFRDFFFRFFKIS
jgi:hypothetical protein